MEKPKELIWTWNKVNIPLHELSDSQLYSIKDTLIKSKNDWFGTSKKVWLDNIHPLIKQREKTNLIQINDQINVRRFKSATLKANCIMNNIVNSSKQTLSIKGI